MPISLPLPSLPPPSAPAMAAAKALHPSGIGTYCYATDAENDTARLRDWQAIARRIDAATGLPDLLELLDRAADSLDHYAAEQGGDLNSYLATEIRAKVRALSERGPKV